MSTSEDRTPPEDQSAGENRNEPGRRAENTSAESSPPSEPFQSSGTALEEAEAQPASRTDEDLPEDEPLTPELVEDEAIRGDFMIRWAVVLLAFLMACTHVVETATLVHVRSGMHTLQHVLPARTGVFSYTAEENFWANLSWLYDALLAAVYSFAGAGGLTVLKALIAAAAFAFVVHTNRRDVSTWWGSVCAALALLAVYPQLTALPEIVTILGLAVTLWLLNRWRETGATRELVALVAVFVVWSNMDPRMYLGLALLLLFALGEALAVWLGFPAFEDARRRKQLWLTVGGCALAALINPFGWHSLLQPWTLYATEYPAWRVYFGGTTTWRSLQYAQITSPDFWEALNHHILAAFVLIAAAAVTFALNFRRLWLADVFVLAGFCVLAALAVRDLPAAALVAGVLATLGAQQWYQHTFRQTYSVETSELVFSRGGRAVTVLGLFAMAYLMISARFDFIDPDGKRVGLGFHHSLDEAIDGMRADLDGLDESLVERPFHFVLEQGDVLVWIGKKSFADSRMGLFAAGDENLFVLFDDTRRAIIPRGDAAAPAGPPWQKTLDRFEVTHALPRLDPRLVHRPVNYITYVRLLNSPDWELLRLGATTAVFCRRQEELAEYRREHRLDLQEQAFGPEAIEAAARPEGWARSPTFYQKYLARPQQQTPNSALRAEHLLNTLQLAIAGALPGELFPPEKGISRAVALAVLAVRHAQNGLLEQPQSVTGHFALGHTYLILTNMESSQLNRYANDPTAARQLGRRFAGTVIAGEGYLQALVRGRTALQQLRHYQTINSLRQMLVIEPKNTLALQLLGEQFISHQKWDLALEVYQSLQAARDADPREPSEAEIEQREFEQGRLEYVADQVAQREATFEQQLEQARQAAEKSQRQISDHDMARLRIELWTALRCPQHALQVYDESPELIAGSPEARLHKVQLLIDAGHFEEAAREHAQLQELTQDSRWREQSAILSVVQADYEHAAGIWTGIALEFDQQRYSGLVTQLPFAVKPPFMLTFNEAGVFQPARETWLVGQFAKTEEFRQGGYQVAEYLLKAALCRIEKGNNEAAAADLNRILEVSPGTPLRPLVKLYLEAMTDRTVELEPAVDPPPDPVQPLQPAPVVAPRPPTIFQPPARPELRPEDLKIEG